MKSEKVNKFLDHGSKRPRVIYFLSKWRSVIRFTLLSLSTGQDTE